MEAIELQQPECESSSSAGREDSSEEELIDENAAPIRYIVIDIKDTDYIMRSLTKLARNQIDPHRMLKIETRRGKCRGLALVEMCCKKQLPMMFQTTQQQ